MNPRFYYFGIARTYITPFGLSALPPKAECNSTPDEVYHRAKGW